MSKPTGRREMHKQATRNALRAAANRLFAERGYEATTIRDIAREAGVTERTVYRYVDGKEGLVAEHALAWIEAVGVAITERPADEPPLVAARAALLALSEEAATALARVPSGRTDTGLPPLELLQRATPRPLRRLEDAIAAGLLERAEEGRRSPLGPDHEARLAARVAVAALRTAANRLRDLQAADRSAANFQQALADAFAALARMAGTLGRA